MSLISKTYSSLSYQFNMIGDFQEHSIEVPLRGWSSLASISLSTTGTTANRYLDVLVSYTIDGINYAQFEPLSLTISVPIKSDFVAILKFVRAGVDNTGSIVLNAFTLNGNFTQNYYDVWNMSGTMFSGVLYEDERWNKLWLNLLRKIYKEGIVPQFIDRGVDIYPLDKTYIEYWKYQCMFWALCVELAYRKIEDLSENKDDLLEFLKQKSLFFCEDDVTLEQLQYVEQNLWDEIRQRGTHMIHYKANTPLGGGSTTYDIPADLEKQVDGELLRYLCYDALKEHVFAYYPRHLSGWTLDRTSPNYHCYTEQIQLNKAPSNYFDFKNLDGFTVYNSNQTYLQDIGAASGILTEDDGFFITDEFGNEILIDEEYYGTLFLGASDIDASDLLELEESAGEDFFVQEDGGGYIALEEGGLIGDLGIVGNGIKFPMVVDSKLSYECTMWVYGLGEVNNSTSIWVKAYKGSTQVALLRSDGAIPLTLEANVLFQTGPKIPQKMWFLRFTIDSIYENVNTDDVHTNWGVGNNLRFYDIETDKLEIFILNQGTTDFSIWDLKFRPMKFENTYGLDNYNTTVLLSHLNNTQVTEDKFVDDCIQYLLPYGGGLYFKDLSKVADDYNLLTEEANPIITENEISLII